MTYRRHTAIFKNQNEAEYPDTDRRNSGIGGGGEYCYQTAKGSFSYFMNAEYITHDKHTIS